MLKSAKSCFYTVGMDYSSPPGTCRMSFWGVNRGTGRIVKFDKNI